MRFSSIRLAGYPVESVLSATLLVVVAIFVWRYNVLDLEARLAFDGFSPTYFVAAFEHPDWFANNYPSGAATFLKSLPMAAYLVAAAAYIPIIAVMKAMIALEIVLLSGSGVLATRMLHPNSDWAASWLVGLFLIVGGMFAGDFGRWGHPHYGWAYNFAYAGVIVGIATAITKRLNVSAIALSFAVSSHVIMGLLGTCFAAAAVATEWRNFRWRQLFLSAAIYGTLAGGWLLFIGLTSDISGNAIPGDLYVAITRMMNYHWYPVEMGLFWERHWERLFPFLSIATLLAVYLPDQDGAIRSERLGAAAGFSAMLVLTAAGILLSHYEPDPFVMKLALHRASAIFLLFAAPYIVAGIWQDFRSASILRAGCAILLLLVPFFIPAGVPVALAAFLGLVVVGEDVSAQGATKRCILIVATLFVLGGCVSVFWFEHALVGWRHWAYTGISGLELPQQLGIGGIALVCLMLRKYSRSIAAITLMVGLGWGAWHASTGFIELRDPVQRVKAYDYLAVQLWAHDHTAVGALFMPDPTHYYGWREFSLRPSLGNLREWLHSGWIYDSKREVFLEGLRRFSAFHLDLKDYLESSSRPWMGSDWLTADIRKLYYGFDKEDLLGFSHQFGVRYFVFDKSLITSSPDLPIVFENASYRVLAAPNSAISTGEVVK